MGCMSVGVCQWMYRVYGNVYGSGNMSVGVWGVRRMGCMAVFGMYDNGCMGNDILGSW